MVEGIAGREIQLNGKTKDGCCDRRQLFLRFHRGPHLGRPPHHPSFPLRVISDRLSLRGRAGNAGLSPSSALEMAWVLVGASGMATVLSKSFAQGLEEGAVLS